MKGQRQSAHNEPSAQGPNQAGRVLGLYKNLVATHDQLSGMMERALQEPHNLTLQASLSQAIWNIEQALKSSIQLRWDLMRNENQYHDEAGRKTHLTMNNSESLVFVVDDDPSVRRAMERLMKSMGLGIRTFSSAREFLEFTPPEVPSCVVLDVRMPRMSGLDLQKELNRRGVTLPIIFITGHGDVNMAVKAMKDGAADFLPKPFHDQDLLDAIHRSLEGYQALQQAKAENDAIWERINRLTPRERQVMELVITGMLNKQVAYELGAAEKTVKVHRGRVMEKMEVESVAELVRLTSRVGIEGPEKPEPAPSAED